MIKHTVNYTNFNDEKVSKDFWFHLSKADIAEIQFQDEDRPLSDLLEELGEDGITAKKSLEIFKSILAKAVGKRSEDGERFIKNDDVRSWFFDTDAYSELLFSMIDNPTLAAKLINGMMPKDMQDNIKKATKGRDLNDMTPEELREALKKVENDKKD